MKIINKTPHAVHIVDDCGENIHTFQKCDEPIRLDSTTKKVCVIGTVPITQTKMEGAYLPGYSTEVYYIVSLVVQLTFPHRKDLLVPNEVQRDDSGRIIGCLSLGCSQSFDK